MGARAFSDFMASDQVEVHRKHHLVLNRNPGAGAWLTSLQNSSDTHLLPPFFTVSLLRRLSMSIWDEDSISPHCGQTQDRWETMPSRVLAEATRFADTMLYETWFIKSPVIAALSHRSRKNLVSSFLQLPMMPTFLLPQLPIRPAATSTAQRTCGFLAVAQGRPRRGTSPSAATFARPLCPELAGTPERPLTARSLARNSSMILLPAAQAWASFSARLVTEANGGSWSGGLGFLSSWLSHESDHSALLPSTEACLAFAQRISSTLHRENARAILKRSPGRSGLCLQVFSAEDLTQFSLSR